MICTTRNISSVVQHPAQFIETKDYLAVFCLGWKNCGAGARAAGPVVPAWLGLMSQPRVDIMVPLAALSVKSPAIWQQHGNK
ncbi:MAG: hypothetical protein JO338_09315 [Aquitalea sp.]|nr:hypothetical protein [Aquitalea sp.]